METDSNRKPQSRKTLILMGIAVIVIAIPLIMFAIRIGGDRGYFAIVIAVVCALTVLAIRIINLPATRPPAIQTEKPTVFVERSAAITAEVISIVAWLLAVVVRPIILWSNNPNVGLAWLYLVIFVIPLLLGGTVILHLLLAKRLFLGVPSTRILIRNMAVSLGLAIGVTLLSFV